MAAVQEVPVPRTRLPVTDAEAAARRALRGQIARLERELAEAVVTGFPHARPEARVGLRLAGPRLLSLGDLERLRDALAERLADARATLARRAEHEEHHRILLERMLLDPGAHRRVRIANADLGEPGCGVWHVRPRLGIVGRCMGWWQVKLSSGCPLAT